jgi:hypothetical protein
LKDKKKRKRIVTFLTDFNIDHFPYSIIGDSDSCNSSSTVLRQKEPSKNQIDEKPNVVHISLSLKDKPSTSSNQRRRSRFDEDSTGNQSIPPVIVRKFNWQSKTSKRNHFLRKSFYTT